MVSIEALKRTDFTRRCSASTSSIPSTAASTSADSTAAGDAAHRPRAHRGQRAGAHNGHVPVTAINSVIGLIVADANGLGPVVLSNERSSNVGNVTWLGRDVNHQWSKSISYESLLRDTLSQLRVQPRPLLLAAAAALGIRDRRPVPEQSAVLPRLHQLQPAVRDRRRPPGRDLVRTLPQVPLRLRADGTAAGPRGGRGDLRPRSVRRPGQPARFRGHRRPRRAQAVRVRRRILRSSRVPGVGPRRRRLARRAARRGIPFPP